MTKRPLSPSERAARRQFIADLWKPSIPVVGMLLVSVVTTWQGCGAIRSDLQALRKDVTRYQRESQQETHAIRLRMLDLEMMVGNVRREAADALARRERVGVDGTPRQHVR